MVSKGYKRKLTTILSADVIGYSRLMGEDEASTVDTLTAYRGIMAELIKQHRGRVVDSPGDNVLAEFSSVVDAVQCGVSVQKEFQARNAGLPANRRMEFRVGINLGDVIEEEGRIYGDGVNIAARLEALADPGGICVSKTAFDHIESKLPLGYQYLGEQTVKNIAKPVGAYRVLMEPRVTVAEEEAEAKAVPSWQRKAAIAGTIAVLVMIIGVAVWNFYLRLPPIEPASVEKMAYPLPEKPSIAVLAFKNLSGDPKQEYLSDGISEAIISALSKVPKMFIIAANSSFTYKGKPVKVQQVAEELGVQYVLEGSVQRSGEKLRVAVQLIDALKGHHLWSERYDLKMEDLLDVQDKIAMNVLVETQVKLTEGEQAFIFRRETNNLKALEKYMEGDMYWSRTNREDNFKARQLYEEALRLDPNFSGACRSIGGTHLWDCVRGWSQDPAKSLQLATKYAQKALALDENNSRNLWLWGAIHTQKGEHEKAIEISRRAVEINPNHADVIAALGGSFFNAGRYEEAITMLEKAIRLNPFPPGYYFRNLGVFYWFTGRYEEAIAASKKALHLNPDDITAFRNLAAIYVALGKGEEAHAAEAEVLRLEPNFTVEQHFKRMPWKDREGMERFMDALRKAGLPDGKSSLPLPDKPSIAVLPFVNMSGDPEQEYFSDGITEEIITALSKIESMFVIARNSTFNYKDKQFTIQQVAEELGVRYVLEGSVRRSGDRVRVTAQLVDAISGSHLWAERYDRELKDIFVVQDDITKQIITAMQVKLTKGEQARMWARGTNNLEAYLKFLQGWEHAARHNMHDNLLARKLYEEAIALDPHYATAYAYLGYNIWADQFLGSSEAPGVLNEKAFELAKKALSLDDSLPAAHRLLGSIYLARRDYDKVIAEGELAIALDPNGADAYATLGRFLFTVGEYEKSIAMFKEAMRLNPFPPNWYFANLAWGYILAERYEEAIEACKRGIDLQPRNFWAHLHLAAAYSLSGHEDLAHGEAAEALKINPKFSVEYLSKPPGVWKKRADIERYCEGLRKAGLK